MADDVAATFYDRLFELDPSLRRLFGYADMPRLRAKLMQTLAVAVRCIDRIDVILPEVEALGRRHGGYGVRAEQYATVGSALIWALEHHLGDAMTDDDRHAWAAAYRRVSSVMIEAARWARVTVPRSRRRQWRGSTPLPLGWQVGSTPT